MKIAGNVLEAKGVEESGKVLIDEIKILEDTQHPDIGNEAHNKQLLPPWALRQLDHQTGNIINEDKEEQNENVLWHQHHVEVATSDEQQYPAGSMGQSEVCGRDNREENEELQRVK